MLSAITVTSLADNMTADGLVTLREALAAANSNSSVDGSAAGDSASQDEITFQTGLAGTIQLDPALGSLAITEFVKITGLGAKNTIIDAQQSSRVFDIASSAGDVAFAGVTITGGKTTANVDRGGGIRFLSPGTLSLVESAVEGNSTTGFNSYGGGIYSQSGAITITSSTVSGNSTSGTGADGGAIFSASGPVRLTNSTMSGNSTSGYNADGAAIYTTFSAASVTLTNSTISGNAMTGPGGSGALNILRGSLTLANSIVSGNSSSTSSVEDVKFINYSGSGTFTASHSLIGVNDGTPLGPAPVGSPDANGNFVGTSATPLDAKLGPLADNGGPTKTMALLPNSPALNAGDNALAVAPDSTPLAFDQRGAGFPRILNSVVDMGSVEFTAIPASPLVVTTLHDELDADLSDPSDLSLREAITLANATTGMGTISFAPGLTGTIALDPILGPLAILDTVEITGLGAKNTIINAQQNSRVFDIASSAGDVTLAGMTITGGKTTADVDRGGGIRFLSPGVLSIVESAVEGNSTTGFVSYGGGIFSQSGAITITSSTISGNSTSGTGADGGAIFSGSGPVNLTNSTMSGNSTSGYNADGAAMYTTFSAASVTLTNSTISGNAMTGPGGSGALNILRGSLTLANSIVSGNTASTSPVADVKFINYSGSGTFTASHSLIGVNAGTPLAPAPVGSPDANGNLVGTPATPLDAKLGPLADNGGPTKTMALLPNSPALNAGDNALAVAPDSTPLANDQRGAGFPRILVGTVDMGAFEAGGIFIDDLSITEGNSGIKIGLVTIRLAQPPAPGAPVIVIFATSFGPSGSGKATPLVDALPTLGIVVFTASSPLVRQIPVFIIGDTSVEPNETFEVRLLGAANATIMDGTGVVTIVNDDSALLLRTGASEVAASGVKVGNSIAGSLEAATIPPIILPSRTGVAPLLWEQVASPGGSPLIDLDEQSLTLAKPFSALSAEAIEQILGTLSGELSRSWK